MIDVPKQHNKETVAQLKVGDLVRIADSPWDEGRLDRVQERNARGWVRAGGWFGVYGQPVGPGGAVERGSLYFPFTDEQRAEFERMKARDTEVKERLALLSSIDKKLATYTRPHDLYSFSNEHLKAIDAALVAFVWPEK